MLRVKLSQLRRAWVTQTPLLNNGRWGIQAITPQVLAPRLPQPFLNQPNFQNIQLPPGTLHFFVFDIK